jgi:hypothetical protein
VQVRHRGHHVGFGLLAAEPGLLFFSLLLWTVLWLEAEPGRLSSPVVLCVIFVVAEGGPDCAGAEELAGPGRVAAGNAAPGGGPSWESPGGMGRPPVELPSIASCRKK